jgi:hypothetical protein
LISLEELEKEHNLLFSFICILLVNRTQADCERGPERWRRDIFGVVMHANPADMKPCVSSAVPLCDRAAK